MPDTSIKSIVAYRALDWVATLVLGGVIYPISIIEPFERFFLPPNNESTGETDPTISYPHTSAETVPDSMLIGLAFGIPIGALFVVQLVQAQLKEDWNWKLDMHCFFLALLQSFVISQFFTSGLKAYAGRNRPDFYERLATGDASEISRGKKSYPSGHASLSFMAMTFLALYLAGKVKMIGHRHAFTLFSVCILPPMILAAFISASRTRDYVHNFSDINAGAAIGLSSAVIGYYMNYPGLSDKSSDIPYSQASAEAKQTKNRVSV